MASRNDRRRRVLKEELLSVRFTSTNQRTANTSAARSSGAGRYSEAASIENHPQISDLIPRRHRTFAFAILLGIAAIMGLEALHFYAVPIAVTISQSTIPAIDLTAPGSLATWLSAVLLLLVSFTSLLTYSLRRHRIDDYRGRYRVWLKVSAACFLLSINSVIGLHHLLAATLAHFTQWTALRGHAVWWLACGIIPLSWIALRMLLDVKESRLAAPAMLLSLLSYAAGLGSYLGWIPMPDTRTETMITAGSLLLGHWMLLISVVSYARFVVLDAQGLIERKSKAAEGKTRRQNTDHRSVQADSDTKSIPSPKSTKRNLVAQANETQWVDGSEPESKGFYEDESNSQQKRRLSKSERKRLRKLRARNQAA